MSDLAEKTYGGGTPATSNEAYWNGDIPWIQSSDVVDGKLLGVEPRKWITQDGLNNSAAQLIPGNSIAIITRVGVGKLAFMPYSYATSQDFLSLSKLNAEPIFSVYACYKKLQSELNAVQGTSIKGITKDELLAKNIMVPRYAEQQQIGAFFKQLDHLITLHQRKFEKLTNVKKSMLEKMFPQNGSSYPEIRFKGFTDPWEQRKVSELFRVTRGYVLAATQTETTKTDEKPYPVYSSQTKDKGLMGYYKDYLYEDAITWTTDGANAGTVNYRAGKFYCTNVCGVLLSNEVKANQMIAEALNSVAKGYVSYVGNPKLMNNVMADIVIQIPTQAEEREQLSSFFAKLDNLITLHQRKCISFTGRAGRLISTVNKKRITSSWEQRKLGELVDRVVRKNTNNESTLPLTISAQYGLVDQITYFNNRVASRDVSNYYLVLNGEFAYNKSTSDGYPFGAVKRLDLYEKGVLSTLYIVFAPKKEQQIDSDYLTVFFDTDRWHKGVAERAAEGARNHGLLNISAEDFFDIDLSVPKDIVEQKQIGAFIRQLDNLITLHQRELEKLQNIKKSMLEKMFV